MAYTCCIVSVLKAGQFNASTAHVVAMTGFFVGLTMSDCLAFRSSITINFDEISGFLISPP